MEGRTIHAAPPVSRGAIAMLVLALALCGIASATGSRHWLIAAIMPASVAVALWFGRTKRVLLTIEPDGLRPLGSSQTVRYDAMRALAVDGSRVPSDIPAGNRSPLEIHHDFKVLIIPANSSPPLPDVHRYVASKLPEREELPINPLLADYVAEQRLKFGTERILVIRTRDLFPKFSLRRRGKAVCAALMLTGIVWIVLSSAIGPFAPRGEDYQIWFVIGSLTIVGSWFVFFYLRSTTFVQPRFVAFPNSCIVIGPAGLAMVQGEMYGALRWEELIKVVGRPKSFQRSSNRILRLFVRGGEIDILDIYERSLADVERQIRARLSRT
jgi:hypothetical protein